jgi:hypothetical protein
METCWDCQKEFLTSQGRKAHQKTCKQRKARREQQAALGTASLRQPVPQANGTNSPSRPFTQQEHSQAPDPFAPLLDLLRKSGTPLSKSDSSHQTPAQRRRTLLQEAKVTVIDQYWYPPFPITAQMKADARLHIDRELRNEPLEEWPLSESLEMAASLRDRVYTAAHREIEKATKLSREEQERDLNELRGQTERTKRKEQWIAEALSRLGTKIRVHSIPPLIALQAICDIKAHLGMTLSGAESLPDAYAAIDAAIQSRVAEWRRDGEIREERKREKWIEGATAVGLVIGFCYLYVYAPQIFKYLFDILFSGNQRDAAPNSPPQNSSTPPSEESAMPSDWASYSPYEDPEQHSYP